MCYFRAPFKIAWWVQWLTLLCDTENGKKSSTEETIWRMVHLPPSGKSSDRLS